MSITSNKLLRYIIVQNEATQPLGATGLKFRNMYLKQLYLLDKYDDELLKNLTSDDKKIIFLTGIFCIGKIFKSSLLTKSPILGGVTLETFLKKGLEVFFSKEDLRKKFEVNDIDDLTAILTMKQKLIDYLQKGELFSILIDSTASGIMHLNC